MSQLAIARRYFARGRQAAAYGDFESAADSLRAATDLAPTFLSARLAYAHALVRSGDPPRAAQVIRNGIARLTAAHSPRHYTMMWCAMGEVSVAAGDPLGAQSAYEEALKYLDRWSALPGVGTACDPVRASIDDGLARVYAKLGHHAQSLSLLSKAASVANKLLADS